MGTNERLICPYSSLWPSSPSLRKKKDSKIWQLMHFKDAFCIRISAMNNTKQSIKKSSLETVRKRRKLTLYTPVIKYANLFKEAGSHLSSLI